MMWSPPPHLKVKVNFDGAVFNESNSAGIGVVIWDDLGQVMASMSESVHLPSSVDEIEEPSFASFGHLIEDAKVLTESFVDFTVSHVKRQ